MKLDLVHLNDDWIGLYVDGQLRAQSHSLEPGQVIAALGMTAGLHVVDNSRVNFLPMTLDELKKVAG